MSKDFENANEMFDALMEYFNRIPKATVKAIDPKAYRKMTETAVRLKNFLQKAMPIGEMTMEMNADFNLGSISVDMDSLSVNDIEQFASIVSSADNFEVYPLTNGRLRFDITFQCILRSI